MKKVLKIVGAVAAVAALGFCALVACSFADIEASRNTVDDFLQGVISQSKERVSNTYSGTALIGSSQVETYDNLSSSDSSYERTQSETQSINTIIDKMCDFSYEITDFETQGEIRHVTVEFQTYSIGLAMHVGINEYESDDSKYADIFESMANEVSQCAEKDLHSTTTLTLRKRDGKWKIDQLGDDQLNAMFGDSMRPGKYFDQ